MEDMELTRAAGIVREAMKTDNNWHDLLVDQLESCMRKHEFPFEGTDCKEVAIDFIDNYLIGE